MPEVLDIFTDYRGVHIVTFRYSNGETFQRRYDSLWFR